MDDTKLVKSAGKKTPPNAGKGRKPGSQNKVNREIKDMINGALNAVGGQKYLEVQAVENPVAFMNLIKAVIPKDIQGSLDIRGKVQIISEFPDA